MLDAGHLRRREDRDADDVGRVGTHDGAERVVPSTSPTPGCAGLPPSPVRRPAGRSPAPTATTSVRETRRWLDAPYRPVANTGRLPTAACRVWRIAFRPSAIPTSASGTTSAGSASGARPSRRARRRRCRFMPRSLPGGRRRPDRAANCGHTRRDHGGRSRDISACPPMEAASRINRALRAGGPARRRVRAAVLAEGRARRAHRRFSTSPTRRSPDSGGRCRARRRRSAFPTPARPPGWLWSRAASGRPGRVGVVGVRSVAPGRKRRTRPCRLPATRHG